jgi:VIT1/CCC1 family predicted Fe2+/Mn2+ transporter
VQFTAHDALGAHARDELGIIEAMNARPVQAALASAATFAIGAALPLLVAFIVSTSSTVPYVAIMSLAFLSILGGLAAKAGGANICTCTTRVTFRVWAVYLVLWQHNQWQ